MAKNNGQIKVSFDCYSEIEVRLRIWTSMTNIADNLKQLVRSLCKQAMPFIALGGISDILKGNASTTSAANIMDALLDGLVGVSNRDLYWKELSEFCIAEGTPLEPYEAVLDWLPSDVINFTFDYARYAIEQMAVCVVQPITMGRRWKVLDIHMVSKSTLTVAAVLEDCRQPILTL